MILKDFVDHSLATFWETFEEKVAEGETGSACFQEECRLTEHISPGSNGRRINAAGGPDANAEEEG